MHPRRYILVHKCIKADLIGINERAERIEMLLENVDIGNQRHHDRWPRLLLEWLNHICRIQYKQDDQFDRQQYKHILACACMHVDIMRWYGDAECIHTLYRVSSQMEVRKQVISNGIERRFNSASRSLNTCHDMCINVYINACITTYDLIVCINEWNSLDICIFMDATKKMFTINLLFFTYIYVKSHLTTHISHYVQNIIDNIITTP